MFLLLSWTTTWWCESYRGAFCCHLCCRHWYVDMYSPFCVAWCWFSCAGGISDYWLLAPAALFVHPHARSKPYLSVQPSVDLHTQTKRSFHVGTNTFIAFIHSDRMNNTHTNTPTSTHVFLEPTNECLTPEGRSKHCGKTQTLKWHIIKHPQRGMVVNTVV